jgi:hypothetical protein
MQRILTTALSAAILLYVLDRIPKNILAAVGVVTALLAIYAAYTRPWYFTSDSYLAGLLFLELLAAAVWMSAESSSQRWCFLFCLPGSTFPLGQGGALLDGLY